MFLKDIDYKETQRLKDELAAFGLGGADASPNLLFRGFFFIHKNKSTELGGSSSYTFEFLHKSFGEFLAADFLLNVITERFIEKRIRQLSSDDVLRFCWGLTGLISTTIQQGFCLSTQNS